MAVFTLDFGAGLDITETPGDEFNVSLDLSEVAGGGDLAWSGNTPTVTDLTITSEAQGTILYFNGSNWVVLAVGTSGQHLQTAGAGANPAWATPAPTDADYLVGSAQAGLSAEIVVGTSPGGELGGTWASPTVDATHSGSAHHALVTLSGTPDYITLVGQDIVRGTIDISDDTNLVAGDALTLTGDTIDFDGGTAPGGELGGTWASPTVDATHAGSAHHNAVTIGADAQHSLATQVLSGVAASLIQAGHLELATTAEINTGTDTTRAMPVDQYVASNRNVRYLMIRVLPAATDHTVSTTVGGDFEIPFTAGTIVEIGAYTDTAGVTGTATIDVNLNGTTLMTTSKCTIDTGEKSTRTAATPPVLTTTAVAAGNLITVDIDVLHSGTAAKGLTVLLGIRVT